MAKAKKGGTKKKGPKPMASPLDGMPARTAPDTPVNFQKLDKAQILRQRRPTAQQVFEAAGVADEVDAAATYLADFGPKAIPAAQLAALLRLAGAWSTEQGRGQRWADYAGQQAGIVWDGLLGQLVIFARDYATALFHDPTVADRYPALAGFVGARSMATLRGVATKHEKAKAAGKAPKR